MTAVMDVEYQRRLVMADYEGLLQRVETDPDLAVQSVEWEQGTLFVRANGPGGAAEPYQIKVEPWLYPVGPWRVGFIDPAVAGGKRLTAPDRDPHFWPYLPGLLGGFHVHYQGPHRVFVCRPFTTEYFYYHADAAWEPGVYDLPRVVVEVCRTLRGAHHFSAWRKHIYRGGR